MFLMKEDYLVNKEAGTMLKIYVDTNVYMDLFKGRKSGYLDLAAFAAHLFWAVREKKYQLVISDWVFDEFCKYGDRKDIQQLISGLSDVITIERTSQDEKEAHKLSRTNFPDALHVVLAKKGEAVYLVTRNTKDFVEFQHIIEIVTPEYL